MPHKLHYRLKWVKTKNIEIERISAHLVFRGAYHGVTMEIDRLFSMVSCDPWARTGALWKKFAKDTVMDESADFLPLDEQKYFEDLMHRVQSGSEEAAWEVFDRYGGHIRRAVRRALSPALRSKFDSIDFVQCVWLSFFRVRDKADHFKGPQHLVKFLAGMARNKVRMEVRRRLSSEQYDVGREVPFNDSPNKNGRSIRRIAGGPGECGHRPGTMGATAARPAAALSADHRA